MNMCIKKSNVCCIYQPCSSDTSSCDSCDEKGKNAYERPNHYNRHKHDHEHGNLQKK